MDLRFNPATGLPHTGAVVGGNFTVWLGRDQGFGGEPVSIDLMGHGPGTYVGTITLTVNVV